MTDHNRLRGLFLGFLSLYLAMSFQLHARQTPWIAPSGLSISTIGSSLQWHVMEMAKMERDASYVYAPGN